MGGGVRSPEKQREFVLSSGNCIGLEMGLCMLINWRKLELKSELGVSEKRLN